MKYLFVILSLFIYAGGHAQSLYPVDAYGIKQPAAGFLDNEKIYRVNTHAIREDVIAIMAEGRIYKAEQGYQGKLIAFYNDGCVYRATEYGYKDRMIASYKDGKVYSVTTYGVRDKLIGSYEGGGRTGAACAAVLLIL